MRVRCTPGANPRPDQVLFPHFILLGKLGENRAVHCVGLFLFAALGAPLALQFFAGAWTA